MTEKLMKCEDCFFWIRGSGYDYKDRWIDKSADGKPMRIGECRLEPPRPVASLDHDYYQTVNYRAFPHTQETDWCGKFRKK